MLVLVAQFYFVWNPMHAFHHFDHILQGAFNVFLQLFLTRIKGHVFFLNSDVEKPSLSLSFHFFKQDIHRLMINAN